MDIDDMMRAVNDAELTLRRADRTAETRARLLPGRLRNVNRYTLEKLKRELRDFNAHTGKWK
jgi:hypothetical protein